MNISLASWDYPENLEAEKHWAQLKEYWIKEWKLNTKITSKESISIPEISNKQKEIIKDIFANIPNKRISFQKSKRYQHTVGKNHLFIEDELEQIKIADAVISPINTGEIRDILEQGRVHEVGLRLSLQNNVQPSPSFDKHKLFCIIDLKSMSKIIKFEPDKYSITVQTGISLHQIQDYLSTQGWELPFQLLGQNQLSLVEIVKDQLQLYPHILGALVNTPYGTIAITEEDDTFKSLFFKKNKSYAIPSEITLKIQPAPKYIRTVNALLPNLNSAAEILKELRNNDVKFKNIMIIPIQNLDFIPETKFLNSSKEGTHFIDQIIKKSEDILAKDKTEISRNIAISLSINEYEFNRTSILINTKDIIKQYQGKSYTKNTCQYFEDWATHFPYYQQWAKELNIDTYHFSAKIPCDKMEAHHQVISTKLSRSSFYSKNSLDFVTFFTDIDHPLVEINLYIIASTKHRKRADSPKELIRYFKEFFLLEDNPTANSEHNERLLNVLKNETQIAMPPEKTNAKTLFTTIKKSVS